MDSKIFFLRFKHFLKIAYQENKKGKSINTIKYIQYLANNFTVRSATTGIFDNIPTVITNIDTIIHAIVFPFLWARLFFSFC